MLVQILYLTILVLIVFAIIAFRKKFFAAFLATRVFYREVMGEMKKVAWPGKDDVTASTLLVGISTFILLVVLFVVDGIFGQVVKALFSAQ